ncbi:MAG: phasin family protein [Pseudomonadota bacterium]
MATRADRAGSGARKASATAAPTAPAADTSAAASPAAQDTEDTGPSVDVALEDWTTKATREQLACEIAACRAVLRNARALREVQLQAAERAEAAHLAAAERLLQARGVGDVADVQFELLRTDFDEALQYWTRLGESAMRTAFEVMQESAEGFTRMSASVWDGWNQFTRWQAQAAQHADIAEAEVEHLANPLAASPLLWPMQEATRQTLDMANAAWHDWMDWTGRAAAGGRAATH